MGQLVEVTEKTRADVFTTAMDDDLNTAKALAVLQKLRGDMNKLVDRGLSTESKPEALEEFRGLGEVLGFFNVDRIGNLKGDRAGLRAQISQSCLN